MKAIKFVLWKKLKVIPEKEKNGLIKNAILPPAYYKMKCGNALYACRNLKKN